MHTERNSCILASLTDVFREVLSLVPSRSLSLSKERDVQERAWERVCVSFGDVTKSRAKIGKRAGNAWVQGWEVLMLLSSPATTACWPERNSLRDRCTKEREGGSWMRARSAIVVDRASRSHSTSPLPPSPLYAGHAG